MDFDLPKIPIRKGKRKTSKKTFSMPSASELVSERKKYFEILKDQEDQRKAIMESGEDISLEAAARINDPELYENSEELLECQNILTKQLNNMQVSSQQMTILSENPGISFDQLDLSKVKKRLEPIRVDFINNTWKVLETCDTEEKMTRALDLIFLTLLEMNSGTKVTASEADIICSILLICAIRLQKRCRIISTTIPDSTVMRIILQNVPKHMQTQEFLLEICDSIFSCFKDKHDRLEIASGFNFIKVSAVEIEEQPSYFPLQVARRLLFLNLSHVLDVNPGDNYRRLTELASMMNCSSRLRTLSLYEHYVVLKILGMLRPLLRYLPDSYKDVNAHEYLLKYLSSVTLNSGETCRVDAENIKNLQSRLYLLWRN